MGPTYDLAIMLGDLILILLFFWLIANLGITILNQIYTADARIIQEYSSGYFSMNNFAPDVFVSNQTFPRISHIFAAAMEPQLINVRVGSMSTISRTVLDQASESDIIVKFIPKLPLPYTLSSGISLAGSCISAGIDSGGCVFSSKDYNALEMIKRANNIAVNLLKG